MLEKKMKDEIIQTQAEISVLNDNTCALKSFMEQWDDDYSERLNKIDLFKPFLTKNWNHEQKKLFVKLLYHQRGHFGNILWFMGNYAPDAKSKEIILDNIREEFGKHAPSHEKLYMDFAKSMGVDLTCEFLDEEFYQPFLKEYNHGHLRWLRDHAWDHRLAAFAALERLDNLDYVGLRNIATSLGAAKTDLVFFNVHIHVQHYDAVEKSLLKELWGREPVLVQEAFSFISHYQVDIWNKISNVIFDLNV
jgi:Iron-containing redox enzyme